MTPPASSAFEVATLPDGSTLQVLNSYEASFVISEIYEQNSYPLDDLEGIENPVVLDVGANIGIFVRHVLGKHPGAKIVAFEPAPQVFELLQANTEGFGSRVVLERVGISDGPGEAEFTYYPHYSLLSGFKAGAGEDELLLRSGISAQLAANPRLAGRVTERHVAALADGKLAGAQTIHCSLQTLSHFIGLHDLKKVDVLKVDAERCELPVLRGIQEHHWPLIQRIYMELHETTPEDAAITAQIQAILEGNDFRVTLQPSTHDHPRTLLLHAKRTA